jgi:hypothetical protein
VRGEIELEGEPMNKGALCERYVLCRVANPRTIGLATARTDTGFKDEDN